MASMKGIFWKLALVAICLGQCGTGIAEAVPVPVGPRGFVFVADESGTQVDLTENLIQAVRDARLPLQVLRARWGTGDYTEDLQNRAHHVARGKVLAERVLEMHRNCPGAKVYLVGYGIGSAVVLAAAELLPPNSITRIVLLAPAVSCSYDLRPALTASCEGIDSYYSRFDTLLEHRTSHLFAPGGVHKNPAGLVGFNPQVFTHYDATLHAKLRQYRLDTPVDRYHNGSHHGYYNSRFLAVHVAPLLRCSTCNY
jgi:pimeloyl-ACP methyl ester carboxylesterase